VSSGGGVVAAGTVLANSGTYPTNSASLGVGDMQYGFNSSANALKLINTINDGGYFAFRTQTGSVFSDKVKILNTGNVGIGTTSPANKLTIQGSGSEGGVTNVIRVDEKGSISYGGYIGNRCVSSNTRQGLVVTGLGSLTLNAQNYNIDFITGAITATDDTNLKMRITSAGNVGIGTTDPGTYKLYVNGSFYATSKSSSAKTSTGEYLFYSEESTEHWFSDFGSSKLLNGEVKIYLDPIFQEAISDEKPYVVILSPTSDCNGLYVLEKNKDSFLVKELNNGQSNATFDYKVVGKRRGYEDIRLEKMEETTEK
jgi:hypothetical protein